MLKLENINKTFGNKVAISNLNFEVKEGQILGLIGQNGAGKSTTFRMILDFIKPDSGKILWDNQEFVRSEIPIGFMPEERGLYQRETIINQMNYFADLHGMPRAKMRIELKEWMKRLGVVGELEDKIESLSKGNAQKIQLIATMLFKPKLLILDEPFSGLDPVNANFLLKEIQRAKEDGAVIIFSTHNMENIEKIADKIVMLKHGQTVLNGSITDIYEEYQRLNLRLGGLKDENILNKYLGIKRVIRNTDGTLSLKLDSEKLGESIFRDIVRNQGYIPIFEQSYPTLDEIFKLKTGEKS